MNVLRFLFAAYGLGTFVFAVVAPGDGRFTFFEGVTLAVGLVFFIVAAAALLAAHRTEGRSPADLLAVALYPFGVYYLMFLSPHFGTRAFWVFCGYFSFLAVTGGFMLGLFLSPIIASQKLYTKEEAFSIVRFGLNFMKEIHGPAGYALAGLSTVFAALIIYALKAVAHLGPLAAGQRVTFSAALALAVLIILRFTYRHSIFSLIRDPELREKYARAKHPSS
ncbi:MAG: hypothetical protein JXB04_10625 [Kiritimatiellae bacterium]|nr:hypothetical protein [Kiritimatiellia bacterium]